MVGDRPRAIVHRLPVEVWDHMVATVDHLATHVDSLDRRVTAIEHGQTTIIRLLLAATGLIPLLTASIVSIIEAIK